jgi:hypothetical protein
MTFKIWVTFKQWSYIILLLYIYLTITCTIFILYIVKKSSPNFIILFIWNSMYKCKIHSLNYLKLQSFLFNIYSAIYSCNLVKCLKKYFNLEIIGLKKLVLTFKTSHTQIGVFPKQYKHINCKKTSIFFSYVGHLFTD